MQTRSTMPKCFLGLVAFIWILIQGVYATHTSVCSSNLDCEDKELSYCCDYGCCTKKEYENSLTCSSDKDCPNRETSSRDHTYCCTDRYVPYCCSYETKARTNTSCSNCSGVHDKCCAFGCCSSTQYYTYHCNHNSDCPIRSTPDEDYDKCCFTTDGYGVCCKETMVSLTIGGIVGIIFGSMAAGGFLLCLYGCCKESKSKKRNSNCNSGCNNGRTNGYTSQFSAQPKTLSQAVPPPSYGQTYGAQTAVSTGQPAAYNAPLY